MKPHELLQQLMEAQFERDHCEPERREECTQRLRVLLEEARKLAPDASDLELLAALEDRYRKYTRERLAKERKTGRVD